MGYNYEEVNAIREAKEQALVNSINEESRVVYDTGWTVDEATSIPRRGITDYNRTILFSEPLTDSQMTNIVNLLETVNCPGWTGVRVLNPMNCPEGCSYTFRTTWDSSD